MADSETLAALAAARSDGLISRDAVTIFARDRSDNSLQEFAWWLGDDTVTASVLDGETGEAVSRSFVGQGGAVQGTPLISVGDIVHVNDLSIQRVAVVFSQLHQTVMTMFQTHDVRLCRAEVHRLLFDPAAPGAMIGVPECQFIGHVSLSPLQRPAAGGEGGLNIDLVSDTKELERVNPEKLSDAALQRRHNGDTLLQYVSELASGNVRLPWGEADIS